MVDWLKVLHTFPRNPRLRDIMRGLGTRDKDSATGFALRWLIYVDEQTADGRTGLFPAELDEELARKNGTRALMECGWAALDEAGHVCAVEFGKHCGETAKKRAEGARRKALCIDKKRLREQKNVTDVTEKRYQEEQKDVTEVTEKALPEEEEEKEYNTKEEQLNLGEGEFRNKTARGRAAARPSSPDEVLQVMRGNHGCNLPETELAECARAFYLDKEAVGWVTPKGLPIDNWRAAAMRYQSHWQSNLQRGDRRMKPGTVNPRNNNCNSNQRYE